MILASTKGHLEVVQALLAKGADVNAKESTGYNALIEASRYGHVKLVQALLAKGADVNAKTNRGDNALSVAKEHADVTALLLQAGAKP